MPIKTTRDMMGGLQAGVQSFAQVFVTKASHVAADKYLTDGKKSLRPIYDGLYFYHAFSLLSHYVTVRERHDPFKKH